jgi:hypothetical protein
MERAVLAGETLADNLGVFVDENGHDSFKDAVNSIHLPLKGS